MIITDWWAVLLGAALAVIYFLVLVALHCRIERLHGEQEKRK